MHLNNILAGALNVVYFAPLEQEVSAYFSPEVVDKIRRAYLTAEKAHHGQKRHSGEDYITHPVAVATILAQLRMDQDTIMAALLHDVIEDTYVEKATLAQEFGEDVANIVDGATKLTQIKFENRAEAQAENFRKMLFAMAKDIRVIILKLADRLHNVRTLGVCPPEKRRRIARETLEIYAPIANRLGMHQFFTEFEDLGFEALYPFRYKTLKKHMGRMRGNRRQIIQTTEREITETLEKSGIRFISVYGREKHLYSTYRKMKVKKISFGEIMDVYALRVVVESRDDCYRVLGLVHQLYKPLPGRFKDYIAIPKVNSYQSLHTTLFGPYGLPIEVQIRSRDMDEVAESGVASHWLYKSEEQTPDKAQLKAREWLKKLMEEHASTKSPLEFIENVKNELISSDVYIFTPKGDILVLPRNASVVDFAYSVHTDVGNTCIAAKVNRRLMPLSTQLMSGQTVDIITSPGARPNPAWLNFVVTSRARSKIKQYFKNQKRVEAIEFGRELLDKQLSWFSLSLKKLSKNTYAKSLEHFQVKSKKSLFAKIGLGHLLPMAVARQIASIQLNQKELAASIASESNKPLVIKGSQGMIVNLAGCCRPIPDDPIIGIFNPGQGLVVHTEQCHNIRKYLGDPERYIELQWEADAVGDFKVDLTIEVVNARGVLAKIASVIASSEANIDDITLDSHEGRFNKMHLIISVRNRLHLAAIIRRLRQSKDVVRINRVR